MNNEKTAKIAGLISIIANVALTVVKVGVGLWAGSEALFADGIHSAIDIAVSMAALSALSISYRPPDKEHPYGHGKAEDLAASLVSIILIAAGVFILYSSVRGLLKGTLHSLGQMSLYVGLFSLMTKEILYRYTARLGRKLNSPALKSLAEDHRTDIWGSWAAVLGVGGSLIGHSLRVPWLAYADPVAAFFVGLLILRTSFKMGKEAIQTLMERNVGAELLEEYKVLVMSVPGIKRVDRIRGRALGHYILVDVRASVYGYKTIQEGHDIIREVKAKIMNKHSNVREVLVHLNPYYDENIHTAELGSLDHFG